MIILCTGYWSCCCGSSLYKSLVYDNGTACHVLMYYVYMCVCKIVGGVATSNHAPFLICCCTCGDICIASSPIWIITIGHWPIQGQYPKCLATMAVQCTTQALLAGPRVLSHHNTPQYTGSLIQQDHNPKHPTTRPQSTSHQPISMHTAALDCYSDKHSPCSWNG